MADVKKRLVVKTLKKETRLPEDFVERTWAVLRDFIDAVFAQRATAQSDEQLYTAVTDLVMAKHGDDLYARVKGALAAHVATAVDRLGALAPEPRAFLDAVQGAWARHCEALLVVRNVFIYLDRALLRDAPGTPPLWELGVGLFRERLAGDREVLARTVRSVLALVAAERGGEAVDRGALGGVTRMLASLTLYEAVLAPALLEASAEYFVAEGIARVAALPVPEYAAHVERRCAEEDERAATVFDAATRRRLLPIVVDALVVRHAAAMLDRGVALLLEARRAADLARLYRLFARAGRLEDLRRRFADESRRLAAAVTAGGPAADGGMIAALLAFREDLTAIVEGAFGGAEAFAAAVRAALTVAINVRDGKPAELLAKYVDALMKGGTRFLAAQRAAAGGAGAPDAGAGAGGAGGAGDEADGGGPAGAGAGAGAAGGAGGGSADEQMEAALAAVISLFRCLHGKDVFEAFYRKDLAKRLLLDRSASADAERALLARLKAECGGGFTSKAEGMFKDADLRRDVMTRFRASAAAATPGLVDVDVHVLGVAWWPSYPAMPGVRVPPELAPTLETFERWYLNVDTKGRRLVWQHSLGRCVLRAAFPLGRKELEVSTLQALVLLLFNDAPTLALADIRERTGIEDGELRRTLQSLACGQVRVLRKEPKGRDVGDADAFHFADDFRASLIRLKINTIQLRETQAEVDATLERVVTDRWHQIDAAVVRIMKTRKRLGHAALLAEVFSHLRFPAPAADVKRRIESLIERDYIERDEEDANMYTYLA